MNIATKLEALQRHMAVPQEKMLGVSDPGDGGTSLSPLEGRLSGSVVHTLHGPCFVVENQLDAAIPHGPHALRGITAVSPTSLALIGKDPDLSYADMARAVFLDTETTGLGLGAGTYVFLVGAGYLDGDTFRVRQFFLSGPGRERAFLTALDDFLGQFSTIVTFNGKAFDWPLLETRYIRQKLRPSWREPAHVDLLHPARRLWKRRLDSCALSSLESHILGIARTVEDVAGWEIPGRYFRYQRTGDSRELEGVFYHNLQDILSLASLLVHVDCVLREPLAGLVHQAVDFLCLGKAFERAAEIEMATLCFEEALRRGVQGEDRREALIRLAGQHKRERRWEAALQAWERLVDEGAESALYARVELAKYYEHIERDYVAAVDQVQDALRLAGLYELPWPDCSRRELDHRLSRVLNRALGHRSGNRR